MKKIYKILLISLIILTSGILVFTYCLNRNLETKLEKVKIGENIESFSPNIGDIMYSTKDEKFSDREWYNQNFSVNVSEKENCFVISPKKTWMNKVIVVITDLSGKTKRAVIREL
jgi:hypothetical protein